MAEESLFVLRAGKTAQEGTRLEYRANPRDLNLFIRGNPNRTGDVVRRRFLRVLSAGDPVPFKNGSGRLELARAITGDAASLTARVIVNRIWAAHFGRGLVATPSNFGFLGERPSHPKLLDDLAARFIAGGWSLKTLHREIVMSAAYRQASRADTRRLKVDPENRWLSRMNVRRLDVESWRDAMLAATGRLDRHTGGPSIALDDPDNNRRTIYATIHRREMSNVLLMHDFPDPTSHSPQRLSTTTALQGLYALNGPLLARQADALADRIAADAPSDDGERINRAYQRLFARLPTDRERQIGLDWIGGTTDDDRKAAWQQYAHMLLASNEFLFVD